MAITDVTRAISYYRRGVYYHDRGQWKDAVNNLRDAIDLYPTHVHARLYMGAALAQQKLYFEAIQVLEEGRQLPSTPQEAAHELTRLLAIVCILRHDHPAAVYYLRLASSSAPDDPLLSNHFASVLCRNRQFEEGFDLYLAATRALDSAHTRSD